MVDDASGDGTGAWLTSLDDPRIRSIRIEAPRERSAARNLGLAAARAPAVLFLDDDDRLAARALARLVAALERHPEAVAAIGALEIFDPQGRRRRQGAWRLPVTRPVWPEVLAGWVAVCGQSLFRAEALRRAGGFDAELSVAEDQDLWLRLAGPSPADSLVTLVPAVVLEKRRHRPGHSPEHRARAEEVEANIRAQFLARCPPGERGRAEALVGARGALGDASGAFEAARFGRAARCITQALLRAPSLSFSPVVGPGLALALAKAAVAGALPPAAGVSLRSWLRRLREARGRAPAG